MTADERRKRSETRDAEAAARHAGMMTMVYQAMETVRQLESPLCDVEGRTILIQLARINQSVLASNAALHQALDAQRKATEETQEELAAIRGILRTFLGVEEPGPDRRAH